MTTRRWLRRRECSVPVNGTRWQSISLGIVATTVILLLSSCASGSPFTSASSSQSTASTPSTVTPTPSQMFAAQLQGNYSYDEQAVRLPLTQSSLRTLEIKSTTWGDFLESSGVMDGVTVSGPDTPAANTPIYVEVASGSFTLGESTTPAGLLVAARQVTAPFAPISLNSYVDSTLPTWFATMKGTVVSSS